MDTRNFFVWIMLLLFISIMGCRSDKEKLDDVCEKLKSVSERTDNCDVMAKELEPLTQKFEAILSDLNQNVPDDKDRALYIDSVSQCLSAYTEIKTGVCGKNEAVMKGFPGSN